MTDKNKYLIIGGSTKCGTTSVFNYFEFHHEICPCKMKESRYFLETDYKLIAKQRSNQSYTSFNELFSDCKPGSVLLEATPDYLYSDYAANKIKSEIDNCKLVFILREPVSRLESWYRFASLNGLISAQTTFSDYIQQQQKNKDDAPQHMRSLEQGRYSGNIQHYLELFGEEKIFICFYEDLVTNPQKFCASIASFAGIDPQYFNNYEFKIFNKSVPVKNVSAHQLFRKIKRTIRPATKLLPDAMRKRLKLAGYGIEKTYSSLNSTDKITSVDLSEESKIYLSEYYKKSNEQLRKITGEKIPWLTGFEK